MFKPLHFLFRSNPVFLVFSTLLIGVALFYWGCQKEVDPVSSKKTNISRSISLAEIEAIYGSDGVSDRSNSTLPLDVKPDWSGVKFYNSGAAPAIFVKVDTSTMLQNATMGGHLFFSKNTIGEIEASLIYWMADDQTQYLETWAPLDTSDQFSGMVMVVNQADTLVKIARLQNGNIQFAQKGAIAVSDIMESNVNVQERDGDPDPRTGCYNFGSSFWQRLWCKLLGFLSLLGSFFEHITGDANGTSLEYLGLGSIIFGDQGEWYGNQNNAGNGSVFYQQFSNQMSVCQQIADYYNSFGSMPTNYSQPDLQFCELSSALSLNGTQNECLYRQYGTAAIQDLHSYWTQSDQSPATIDAIKDYLDSKCATEYPAMLADLLVEQFSLSVHPIDIFQTLQSECGPSLNDPQNSLNGALPGCVEECVKKIIVDDCIESSGAGLGNISNDEYTILFENINECGCPSDIDSSDDLVPFDSNNDFMSIEPRWGQLATCQEIVEEINSLNIEGTNLLSQIDQIANHFHYNLKYTRDANGKLIYAPNNDDPRPRYVYSEEYGWVDFHHVFRIMKWCFNSVPGGTEPLNLQLYLYANQVEELGFGAEVVQRIGDDDSAFSYEDLCSNHVGAMYFVNFYKELRDHEVTLASMISITCNALKFVDPSKAPNYKYIPHILDDKVPHVYSSQECLTGDALRNAHKEIFCSKSLETMLKIFEAHEKFPD